jgi:hypothetical protein
LSARLRTPDLRWAHVGCATWCDEMTDIAFIALTWLFFVLAAAYVAGCDRIK